MKGKHSRWITVVGGVTVALLLATMVSASPLPGTPAGPIQATGDADTVDGHHAAYSGATSNSTRAGKVLWATSGGKLHWRSLPLWNTDKRYVNTDRAETIVAASSSPILNVHNTGSGPAIQTQGAGTNGLYVVGATQGGIRVQSAGWDGIEVDSAGWSGIWVQSAGYDAIRVQTAGEDGLRFFEGIGRDYIRAGSNADLDFRVLNSGEVRSDVGYNTPASDFAERMGFEGLESEYEPGDVLVISDRQDRSVELSSSPYSRAVIGVYSANPGFTGGAAVGDEEQGAGISVALLGIVPCKVSAENGAISRGDLLVTSSTPGHAMRADDPAPGTILGKALEPFQAGTGVIEVLVTLQ